MCNSTLTSGDLDIENTSWKTSYYHAAIECFLLTFGSVRTTAVLDRYTLRGITAFCWSISSFLVVLEAGVDAKPEKKYLSLWGYRPVVAMVGFIDSLEMFRASFTPFKTSFCSYRSDSFIDLQGQIYFQQFSRKKTLYYMILHDQSMIQQASPPQKKRMFLSK